MNKSAKKTTEYNGRVETIDCTPTWEWAMSIYIRAIATKGYKATDAVEELMRLARHCDELNKQAKQA